jgi:lysophospholipid acyltransferase (LPLAT)-like uncharacterized protein
MTTCEPQPETESPRVASRRRRLSGVVVPHSPCWYQRVAAWLVVALVRIVSATLRYQWIDRSGYFNDGVPGPAIYCVWHNRLALCLVPYFGYVKKRNQTPGLAALVSASKDGALLAGILEWFGVHPVRGSSSRRGPQALLELTSWAERGYDLAITPDGPRGPRYVVQEGPIGLARITGFPIIPAAYYLDWKIQANSWDRFQFPLPFSRCQMVLGQPICVPPDSTDAEREDLRQQLEQTLKEISRD